MKKFFTALFFLSILGFAANAQMYETQVTSPGYISSVYSHSDNNIYLLNTDSENLYLGKVSINNTFQVLQSFEKPSKLFNSNTIISYGSDKLVIAGLDYDSIFTTQSGLTMARDVRVDLVLRVYNLLQQKTDTIIRITLKDTACIQILSRKEILQTYVFDSKLYFIHPYHFHPSDSGINHISYVSMLSIDEDFGIRFVRTHHIHSNANTLANDILNQMYMGSNRVYYVYQSESNTNSGSKIILNEVDMIGNMQPIDSFSLNGWYHRNNQFYMKDVNTYYVKGSANDFPAAFDKVIKYKRDASMDSLSGIIESILPIYDSSDFIENRYPLSFSSSHMLYIRNNSTVNRNATQFIITDTMLHQSLEENVAEFMLLEDGVKVLPLGHDSFVVAGRFFHVQSESYSNRTLFVSNSGVSKYTGLHKDISSGSTFRIFPNPATTEIHLPIDISTAVAIDVAGRNYALEINTNTNTWDVSYLAPGIYFLTLTDFSGSVVKQKLLVGK